MSETIAITTIKILFGTTQAIIHFTQAKSFILPKLKGQEVFLPIMHLKYILLSLRAQNYLIIYGIIFATFVDSQSSQYYK